MKNIEEVAKKIGLTEENIIYYGKDILKIEKELKEQKGDLILVTAMNPTPFGEGKTTISIGVVDGLNKVGKSATGVLREPSMGPVFGMKGGATGGGKASLIPEEKINLHFTGDFHAITTANNLLCAAIDSHIYWGNELAIDQKLFSRCMDINDRSLRDIKVNDEHAKFNITAASEIMSIFTLSISKEDLRTKLGNIMIGLTKKEEPIFAKDLDIINALYLILEDAFKPNLVQTLEGNPVMVHGGPFANISHGCNSLIATKQALSVSDYVVTEAGFGADLGAEKFLDLYSRKGKLKPKAVVLVATIKSLKYNSKDKNSVEEGLSNLNRHIENIKKFGITPVVALNKFDTDTQKEITVVEEYCKQDEIPFSLVESFSLGGNGSIDLAKKVIESISNNDYRPLYSDEQNIQEKIDIVAKEIYRVKKVIYTTKAKQTLEKIKSLGLETLPICIAKTPYSFTDDPKQLGAPTDFSITVRDLEIYHGAGFIVVYLNHILTMPGLSKDPNYKHIKKIVE